MEQLRFDVQSKEFAGFFNTILDSVKEDPIKYFIKNSHFMDFDPTAAQTVALKCVFGQALDPITKHSVFMEGKSKKGDFNLIKVDMTELELYKFMTDEKYKPELQTARNRINFIVGRRGGKSTLAAMLAIYCSIKHNWKPFLKKHPTATVLILSHSREFSDEVLELVKSLVEDSPILSKLIDKKKKHTQSTFNMRIPFLVEDPKNPGKKKIEFSRVTIKVGAASKKTTRGKAICALICDEIAHWNLDENAAEKDEDILRAARPALMQFREHGLLIKLSSPGIKQGVLYNEYQKRKKLPASYITLKAPSWVWNTILMENEFKEEYIIDPAGFDCEYRANFVDSISNFILPEFVDLCTLRGMKFMPPEGKGVDVVYCAALDAAFKKDRFAFCLMGWNGHRLTNYMVKTWEGTKQKPVRTKTVARYIRNVCKEFGISRVYADQYAYPPLREIFEEFGIALIENVFTNTYKKKIYFNLKGMIHNQKIDLLDNEILLSEIKQLQVEQTATGLVRIGHPPGGHDDCSDCVAISSYILVKDLAGAFIDESNIAGPEHNIRTDITGRAFDAPSPDMLTKYYGDIIDNSKLYRKNPETGKYELIKDGEDGLDDANEIGADFMFA